MAVTNRYDSRRGGNQFYQDFWNDLTNYGPRRDPDWDGPTRTDIPDVPTTAPEPAPADAPFRGIRGPDLSSFLSGAGFLGGGGGGGGSTGFDLASLMLARKGQLGDPDQRTEDMLAAQKEAELQALNQTMAEQSAAHQTAMFGRGISRSTIAGRVGGQLTAQQGMMAAQVEAQAAARDIAVRQDIANRATSEAQIAQQDLASQRQTAVGMAGVAAENNRTAAMLKQAAMDNATKMAIAEGQLGLGYAELDLNRELGFGDLELRRELGWGQIEAGKTKWWQSLLGVAGGILGGVGSIMQGRK